MAAGNFIVYDAAKENLLKGAMNLSSDNFNVILVSGSYSPAVTTDATYANVSADEVTGTGYTAGGVTLASDALSLSSGTVSFGTAQASWPNSTITAAYAVVVHRAGASLASTDLLLGYYALNTASAGATISSTDGAFTVGPAASNWLTLT